MTKLRFLYTYHTYTFVKRVTFLREARQGKWKSKESRAKLFGFES